MNYKYTLLLSITILIIACFPPHERISKDNAYRIGSKELTEMGLDTSQMEIQIIPGHPISLDSIRTGAIRRSFFGNYTDWLERSEGRLEKKTFWRCCSHKKGYLDAIYDLYIDSQTGEVLYLDGMGPRVKRWREQHGVGE